VALDALHAVHAIAGGDIFPAVLAGVILIQQLGAGGRGKNESQPGNLRCQGRMS
jgi:hypothetical protein